MQKALFGCSFAAVMALASGLLAQEFVPQMGHNIAVTAVAVSADGKFVASGDGMGRLLLWQTDNGMLIRDLTPRSEPAVPASILDMQAVPELDDLGPTFGGENVGAVALAFMADNTALLAADKLGRVMRFPLDGTAPAALNSDGNPPKVLFETADGKVAMVTTQLVWNLAIAEGSAPQLCPVDGTAVSAAVPSPDRQQVAVGHADGRVDLWNVGACGPEGKKALEASAGSEVKAMAYLPGGQVLVVAHQNGLVDVLDLAAPEKNRRLESTTPGPVALVASKDGLWVAISYEGGKIRRFNLESGLAVESVDVQTGAPKVLAIDPATNALLGDTGWTSLRKWPTDTKLGEGMEFGISTPVDFFGMFSPDAKRVIVAPRNSSVEGTLRLHNWNLATMKLSKTPELPATMWIWGRWTGLGERVYFRDNQAGNLVWDLVENAQVFYWSEMGTRTVLTLSPEGKRALVQEERTLALYTTKQNADKPLKSVDVPEWVNFADFSADGNRVLAGSDSGITLFDGNKLKRIWGSDETPADWTHGTQLMAMDLSDSGMKAATCGVEGRVTLWDLKAKKAVARFNPGGYGCWSVNFSNNEKKLLIGTTDGRVVIWDLDKNTLGKTFRAGWSLISDAALSSDGNQMRAVASNGTVYGFDAQSGALLYTIYRDEKGEWLVLGPKGALDASPKGKSLVGIRQGNSVQPLP